MRITRKMSDKQAERLNWLLGTPEQPYKDGKAQVGCIHIVSQNGTNNIYQMDNEAGGCKGLAYGLKQSEVYLWLTAAQAGINLTNPSY